MQILRCVRHYGEHLQGLAEALPPLPRISYKEDQEGLELTDQEKVKDDQRVDEELEVLGSIGFKNAKEPYMKYHEAIMKIDKMCKDLCQKLYTGENAQYLVGPDKIPAYLSVFLEKMKRQAEEFKINQVRQLRTSTARFQELCAQIPYSVFSYLKSVYTSRIQQEVSRTEREYDNKRTESIRTKQKHL